jgi:hypothetical protein
MKTLLLCATAILFTACRRDVPQPDRHRIAAAYADLFTTAIECRRAGADSAQTEARIDSVLSADGTTREEIRSALEWYNEDLQRWKPFFDEVVQILTERSRGGAGVDHGGETRRQR